MSYRENSFMYSPFKVDGLEERTYIVKEGEVATVDPNTGEMYVMKRIDRSKRALHDGRRYTKLYAGACDKFIGLSRVGFIMLFYVIGRVSPSKDNVYLTVDDVSEWGGISSRSFYDGVAELLDAEILARKLGSRIEFFFDVNMFFNGDRRRLIKDSLGFRRGKDGDDNI